MPGAHRKPAAEGALHLALLPHHATLGCLNPPISLPCRPAGEEKELGDISTLAEPGVVDMLIKLRGK